MSLHDYDDTRVILCDGAISVDGVMVSASRSFVRDVRIGQPSAAEIERQYRRELYLMVNARPVQTGVKWCCHCGEWCIVELFAPDKRNFDGLTSWCADCRNTARRAGYIGQAA